MCSKCQPNSIWSPNVVSYYSRRLDDNRGRQSELRQTAVKTMRGILFCWMMQSESLEKFKENNNPDFALHSKFNLRTGQPSAGTHEYGHLQVL